jgi:zeaxanthin glucosyltransferase
MRILLVSAARAAHLNPMVGVAQHLRAAGHQVSWLALPAPPPQLARLDLERVVLPPECLPTEPVQEISELSLMVRSPDAWRSWLQSVLLDGVAVLVGPLRQLLRDLRPEVIGLDPTIYPACIAAELEGVPFAGLSPSLQPLVGADDPGALSRMVKSLASARAALFASFGVAPRFALTELLAPTFTAVFAARSYVGEVALPAGVELVGPSRPIGPRGDEPPFALAGLPAGDFAYCSMGSLTGWQPRIFERVAQACARRALPLVLSCGLSPRARGLAELPGQVICIAYAPQPEILQRAKLFISHGSAGSVMEALDAGVPMLLHPLGHDQALEVARAQQAGVGLRLDLEHVELSEIDRALGLLLEDDGLLRRRARAIAADYRARDGAAEAARLLVALAR